ncbi:MAG: cupin domain-containing protein, partial [Ignavibacteria bacterium]
PQPLPKDFETFHEIISNENLTVERIISTGHATPDGQWLEDDRNEWVILLQGEAQLVFEEGKTHTLRTGDYISIPKNKKHKVSKTSIDPPCIWLAIYHLP